MPTQRSKILKEMDETSTIAARIVALASKEKNAAAMSLAKLGAGKDGANGKQAREPKRRS
jgi:hypothetical protein